MRTRSFKVSLKIALAFMIIYAISFYWGWDRAYWAAVGAASAPG
ncbi:MAG: hypothetical protein QNJ94_17365 [Alphaproteobacteria bacterium]|nr:hypothetical protein [Alphaproteobacteria bacterium]